MGKEYCGHYELNLCLSCIPLEESNLGQISKRISEQFQLTNREGRMGEARKDGIQYWVTGEKPETPLA